MTILFLDNFVDTDNTPLQTHTPDVGSGWTRVSGTVVVSSSNNTARVTASPFLYYSDDIGTPDQYARASFRIPSNQDNGAYFCVRLVDADNWIGCAVNESNGAQVALVKSVNGVRQILGTTSHSAGVTIEIRASGSTIQWFKDGAQVGGDITETDFQTESKQGLTGNKDTFTNWLTFYEAGDLSSGTPPSGTTTVDSVTTTETTADVNYSYDAADETGFNYRIDGGATVDAGLSNPIQITGLSASTAYTVEVQAYNGDGTGSWSASFPFSTDAATTTSLTTEPLKNNTGQLLSNESGVIADVYNVVDGALALRKTGLISDGLGVVAISDASLSPATEYRVVIQLSGGEEGIARITSV